MPSSAQWLQLAQRVSIHRVQRKHLGSPKTLETLTLSTWCGSRHAHGSWALKHSDAHGLGMEGHWQGWGIVTNTVRAAKGLPYLQSDRPAWNQASTAHREVRNWSQPPHGRGLLCWHLWHLGKKWLSALNITSNTRRQLTHPALAQEPLTRIKNGLFQGVQ